MGLRVDVFLLVLAVVWAPVLSDLVITKVDRRIDLTSQIARITSTLKVVNEGSSLVSEVLLAFPENQAKLLAHLTATPTEGKGKAKGSSIGYPVQNVHPKDMPPALTFYSVALPKGLGKGDSFTFDVLAVFTHALKPFPEKITQADIQLLVFQESAYYLSPYAVKVQTLSVKLPDARIESYTKVENTKNVGSEIKYGPYENLSPLSYSPIVVHFESNQPFAVAEELVREIEISHWGNIQVTEHYKLVHGGAQSKGEFSRLDYQARPHVRGQSAIRRLVAKLPPRAHSVYYRDEIGNVSTSNLWSDSKKTELEIEPRYPMFGGWRTAFTIGYGLPLHEYLFESDGKRVLNISFGCPVNEVVIDTLIVKSSPAYLAKLQWDEVQAAIQKIQNIINRCLLIHDKLEASLRDLSRTGDVQACKAARKAADGSLKELSKEMKPLLAFLQSSQQAAQILPKVEELVVKEKDLEERLMVKHSTVVDCYEKKYGGREIESRVASHLQKIAALRQEVDDLLDFVDEI
ncbi:hypothetical protein C1H46_040797 [Malus baccata]|uniref:Dolichyl-diphosphooligosaccharide--protein glycosyltransferase subunit 1 n=1 Tax=Malus baccata TaxID=106549 RepID=A0A540KHH6_MALBA|nr:hypothetical protein C1H46_040797 [Malus baccata]